jgi:hypothetical protein
MLLCFGRWRGWVCDDDDDDEGSWEAVSVEVAPP